MGPASEGRIMRLQQRFVARRRMRVADMAAEEECSPDTIKRAINVLRDYLYMNIEYDRASRYWVYTPDDETPAFTTDEFVALSLSAELLRRVAGTRFEQQLRGALEKVGRALPPVMTVDAERGTTSHSFALDLLRGEQDMVAGNLTILSEAIRAKNSVRTEYFSFSSGESRDRFLDPYHLRFHGDAWYCIAYCHLREEVRTFAVQRMHQLTRTQRRWQPQPGFDLQKHLGSAFSLEPGAEDDLVVRFGPQSARYVRERRWHPTQQIEELPDGGIILRARVFCGGEVQRWVLQYGADAEVLSPSKLRDKVAQEVAGMGATYE